MTIPPLVEHFEHCPNPSQPNTTILEEIYTIEHLQSNGASPDFLLDLDLRFQSQTWHLFDLQIAQMVRYRANITIAIR